jgi:hypothetical protein
MKLDLASGQHPKEGFRTVDLYWEGADYCWDLTNGARWPWDDSSIDELHCSHFIEHIPADEVRVRGRKQDRLLFFFDEAYRIIKPEGLFTIIWPSLKSSSAFRDPTHRRFLPLEFTHYLSKEGRGAMGIDHYNVLCDWRVKHTTLTVNRKPDGTEYSVEQRALAWDVQEAWCVQMIAVK